MFTKRIGLVLAASMLACSIKAAGVYAEEQPRESIALFNYTYTGATASDGTMPLAEDSADDGYQATGGIAVRSSRLFASLDGKTNTQLVWSSSKNTYIYGDGSVVVPVMAASDTTKWGDTPYFLIKTSTAEYKDIKFSARVGGTNKGPRDYKLQYSTDGSAYTDICPASVASNKDLDGNQIFNNVSIPEAASDKENVYFRIIAASKDTIGGKDEFPNGTGGEAAINDIRITGVSTKTKIAEFSYSGSASDAGKELPYSSALSGYSATGGAKQSSSKLFASLNGNAYTKLLWSSGNNNFYMYNGKTDAVVPVMEAKTNEMWGSAPYFLVKTSTAGYKDISFSAKVSGTNAGPKDYKLQYSTDGTNYTTITQAAVTANKNLDVNQLFANIPVPDDASDMETVWFKIVAASTTTLEGSTTFANTSSGEAAINDVIIRGIEKPAFPGVQGNITKYTAQSDDPAYAYTATIDYSKYSAPNVKWVITNEENNKAEVNVETNTVISGNGSVMFGLIITGKQADLDTINSVCLEVQ